MRERELKPSSLPLEHRPRQSLPMRERELKPYYYPAVKGSDAVAPHAGARIETCCGIPQSGLFSSLPMRERELKHFAPCAQVWATKSLPMRERELKRDINHGAGT